MEPQAWRAALLLGACSPLLVYARSFFSEPLIALWLALALWLLQTRRPGWAGLAVGIAAAIKPPYALTAFGLAAELAWSGQKRQAMTLLFLSGVVLLAVAGFNVLEAGTPLVAGQLGWEWVKSPGQVGRTLVSLKHGLVPFVPWALMALVALVRALTNRRDPPDHLLRQIGLAILPCALLFAVHGHQGETCYGCRYWVPLLPWLAVAATRLAGQGRWPRPLTLALTELGMLFALSAALLGTKGIWDASPLAAVRLLRRR
jgi:hypothetical protein